MGDEHTESSTDTTGQSKERNDDVERQSPGADIPAPKESAFKSLGWLDRLLALWILLAMAIGILLGNFVPSVGPSLKKGEFVGVSIPIGKSGCSVEAINHALTCFVAIGLLVMMYPILCKVQYETLHLAFRERALWIQIGFSIILNWIIAPFLMVRHSSICQKR